MAPPTCSRGIRWFPDFRDVFSSRCPNLEDHLEFQSVAIWSPEPLEIEEVSGGDCLGI